MSTQKERLTGRALSFAGRNTTLTFFVCAFVVLSIASPSFLTFSNITGLLNQICIYGVASLGMTILIIGGEWDMSMGSVLAMSSLITAYVAKVFNSELLSFVGAMAVGMLVGLLNAVFIVKGKVNTFITTLATLVAVKGMAVTFCEVLHTPSSIIFNNNFLYALGNSGVAGVPYFVVFFILLVIGTEVLLKKTKFGRAIYAMGGNYEIARTAGINTRRTKFIIFTIAGGTAGLAGFMMASKMLAGIPLYAADLPLTAVSAAVIGGNSLEGGRGSAFKTLLGLVILGMITNTFNLFTVNVYVQDLVKGSIIIAVVVVDALIIKRRKIRGNFSLQSKLKEA